MKKAALILLLLTVVIVTFGQSVETKLKEKQSNSKKMDYEARLSELKLQLPPVSAPKGLYRPMVIVGNIAYLSGHVSAGADGQLIQGKVGSEYTMDEGKQAARNVGLAMLATLRHELGSLNKVKRVIKILGMVNSTPDFDKHPYVINGCSEVMQEVFGSENGVGARSAFGVAGLPGNCAVEIEAIFELVEN